MNKRIFNILFYLSLLVSQTIFSQTTLNDTLIINNLIQTADSITVNEPQKALTLADSAMTIAKNIGVEKFVAKCRRRKIDANYYLGKYQKAVDNLFLQLAYHKAKKDSAKIASCYSDIGTIYTEMMEDSLSLKFLYKAMDFYKTKENSKEKTVLIGNIGYTYLNMGSYVDALKYFKKSLTMCEEMDYNEGIATTNSNIGKVYTQQRKYKKALPYFKKALNKYSELNDNVGIAMAYNRIGILKYHLKEYNKAIKYFSKSAELREQIGDIHDYISSISNIAYINNLMGNSKKAILKYNEALSKAYENNYKDVIIGVLKNLSKVYVSIGDYPKAYQTLEKYSKLKDEVYNKEKSETVEKLKVEYETEQKEAEINNLKSVTELQNKTLEQRQMIIILLIGSLALLGLLGYLGISRYRMKAQQNSMELEQRLLRSQMNPHFIFNSLSVIQGYIFDGSKEEAASYLSNFSKLMRNILENSREEYVMLSKEIETLNHYLDLQNLRHGGKIKYNIIVSDSLPPDSVSVPPMIAQPFIENSIKHGMEDVEELSIVVKYIMNDDKMKLIIEDNGIGINQSQKRKGNEEHNSLAISITEGRLQLLSKCAKKKFKLKIIDISEENENLSGTRVEVELPYLEEF
jgi:tetratricopeptide (TPR) repeat protein